MTKKELEYQLKVLEESNEELKKIFYSNIEYKEIRDKEIKKLRCGNEELTNKTFALQKEIRELKEGTGINYEREAVLEKENKELLKTLSTVYWLTHSVKNTLNIQEQSWLKTSCKAKYAWRTINKTEL